ncbi:thioesterase II family protein [Nonomuraea sp. NPDC050556]|uniref:thioesterase II family protein n=1 Tax=Nonomuraea sp. NPDC050556 TaxID=3364369 RepID=UPI003794C842
MRGTALSSWLPFRGSGRGVSVLCLPHAGGAAHAYHRWARSTAYLRVDFVPVELPGRGSRVAEAPATDLGALTEELADVVDAHAAETGRPYALFGHSMGGMLAYNVAVRLAETSRPGPACLIVSGCRPPQRPRAIDLNSFDDDTLVTTLLRIGGLPEAVAADAELLAMVLPAMRADLALFAGYRRSGPPLPTPIIAMAGTRDPLAQPQYQQEWQPHTSRELILRVFRGGHFYLHDIPDEVMLEIDRSIGNL